MKRTQFTTVQEAREVLAKDKLGTVYVGVEEVFVATCYGTGTFTRRAWGAEKADVSQSEAMASRRIT